MPLIQDFSGGMNTKIAPNLLPPNQAQLLENVDVSSGSLKVDGTFELKREFFSNSGYFVSVGDDLGNTVGFPSWTPTQEVRGELYAIENNNEKPLQIYKEDGSKEQAGIDAPVIRNIVPISGVDSVQNIGISTMPTSITTTTRDFFYIFEIRTFDGLLSIFFGKNTEFHENRVNTVHISFEIVHDDSDLPPVWINRNISLYVYKSIGNRDTDNPFILSAVIPEVSTDGLRFEAEFIENFSYSNKNPYIPKFFNIISLSVTYDNYRVIYRYTNKYKFVVIDSNTNEHYFNIAYINIPIYETANSSLPLIIKIDITLYEYKTIYALQDASVEIYRQQGNSTDTNFYLLKLDSIDVKTNTTSTINITFQEFSEDISENKTYNIDNSVEKLYYEYKATFFDRVKGVESAATKVVYGDSEAEYKYTGLVQYVSAVNNGFKRLHNLILFDIILPTSVNEYNKYRNYDLRVYRKGPTTPDYKLVSESNLGRGMPENPDDTLNFAIHDLSYDLAVADNISLSSADNLGNSLLPSGNYKQLVLHLGRLFTIKDNTLLFSKLGKDIVYWPPINVLEFTDTLTGLISSYQGIYIFSEHKTWLYVLRNPLDRNTWILKELSQTIGCINGATCQEINGVPIWLGKDGFYTANGAYLNNITKNIMDLQETHEYAPYSHINYADVFENKYVVLTIDEHVALPPGMFSGCVWVLDFSQGLRFYTLKKYPYPGHVWESLAGLFVHKNNLILVTYKLQNDARFYEYNLKKTNGIPQYKYISPAFTDGNAAMLKSYSHVYLRVRGNTKLRIWIDGTKVKDIDINGDEDSFRTEDILIPTEYQRGYEIVFGFDNIQTLPLTAFECLAIDCKPMVRQNGR